MNPILSYFRGTIIGLTRILPYLLAAVTKFFMNVHCSSSITFISGISLSELTKYECRKLGFYRLMNNNNNFKITGVAIAGLQVPDLTDLPMQE